MGAAVVKKNSEKNVVLNVSRHNDAVDLSPLRFVRNESAAEALFTFVIQVILRRPRRGS